MAVRLLLECIDCGYIYVSYFGDWQDSFEYLQDFAKKHEEKYHEVQTVGGPDYRQPKRPARRDEKFSNTGRSFCSCKGCRQTRQAGDREGS